MYLYNSATHRKDEFVPNHPDIVKMYTCGPTVYHFAHPRGNTPTSSASRTMLVRPAPTVT